MMGGVMAAPAPSTPVRVRDLLVAALPELRDHMLEETIRRNWQGVVGPEFSRRSWPGRLRMGVLEVNVDNSPCLYEMTLRSAALLANLQARFGPAVTSLRLGLGSVRADAEPVTAPRRSRSTPRLAPEDISSIDALAASLADPALADSFRRLLTKDFLARRRQGSGSVEALP
jgi:hypothetical protein